MAALKMQLQGNDKNLEMALDQSGATISSKDYVNLLNKPKISGVELVGDKDFDELGMERMTNTDIFNLIGGK